MNIYVEKNGNVHLQGENDGVLNLHSEREIVMWEAQGLQLLKPNGPFDNVTAFSPEVEEFLTNQKK